jgi:DNA oxidative demethylase
MTLPLFPSSSVVDPIGPQAFVLREFAREEAPALVDALHDIEARSPFRHMVTPGGFTMSVALTNCGRFGWFTDRRGYRYTEADPASGAPWPEMPAVLLRLAQAAATATGFANFEPDSCLINRYLPGSRLTLHQDRNERSFDHPIVSVSLGIPAVFLFGGTDRGDRAARVPLRHGDVAVWGGADRLRYHGILPLKPATHPLVGERRLNFTLRKAG